jgi:flagellar basal body-associated protein FliL
MMKNKRGSAWIWIIVILVLIAIGVGLYFWLSGGDTTPVVDAGTNAGNSIIRPPTLPE